VRRRVPHERTHAERLASTDGYFAPESVIRRLGNSPLVPLLGGGTAVLLQVAHPLVAAGVAEHSDYRNDLWRRLARTLHALYLVSFGSRAEAELAAASVRAVHARVRGTTRVALGPFPPGTAYSAEDPELQLWVHATLVEASLSAWQRFERPLTAEEREQYYTEMAVVARLFGVPAETIPPSLGDFRAYVEAQLASPAITVTPPAAAIADVILKAPLPAPLRLFAPAHRLATTAQLPPRLRAEYGLTCGRTRRLLLPAAAWSVKATTRPVLRAASRISRPSRLVPVT
jgi:uncharacterized protein (DUF2236 family)